MKKLSSQEVFNPQDAKTFEDCTNLYVELLAAFGFDADIKLHVNNKNMPKIFFVTIDDHYKSRFFRSLTMVQPDLKIN